MLNLENREVMEAEVPFLVKYCCIKRDCQLVHWHVGATTKQYLSALLLDITLLWNELGVNNTTGTQKHL
jgi:hypothetical protein